MFGFLRNKSSRSKSLKIYKRGLEEAEGRNFDGCYFGLLVDPGHAARAGGCEGQGMTNQVGFDTLVHPCLCSQRMDATMKLSRKVAHAVRATLQLSQHPSDSLVPCSKLASEGNMPERFLLQILRNLVNHGILRSARGLDGGYALARPPDEISLLDVIEAIDGPMNAGDLAGDGLPVTSQTRCRMRWKRSPPRPAANWKPSNSRSCSNHPPCFPSLKSHDVQSQSATSGARWKRLASVIRWRVRPPVPKSQGNSWCVFRNGNLPSKRLSMNAVSSKTK